MMSPNTLQAYAGSLPSERSPDYMPMEQGPTQTPTSLEGLRSQRVATCAVILASGFMLLKDTLSPGVASAQQGECVTTTEEVPGPEPGTTATQTKTECTADGSGNEGVESAPTAEPETATPASEPAERENERDNSPTRRPRRYDLSERQYYAGKVIALINDGKISIEPLKGGKHQRDRGSLATPMQNLKSARAGKSSRSSDRCGNAPDKAYLNPKILKFVYEVGKRVHIKITALVGGCHSDGSGHYGGDAVDIGCPVTPKKESVMRRAGRKLGIKRYMPETCANAAHQHWSTTGR